MGVWIRTQNREYLVEVTGLGIKTKYDITEIVGLNKSLHQEHLRILRDRRKSKRNPGRNTKDNKRGKTEY